MEGTECIEDKGWPVRTEPMYLVYWGFHKPPCSVRSERGSLLVGPTQDEALARLHYLRDAGRRLALMLGPAGCGKTLLLDYWSSQLCRSGAEVATISLLGLDSRDVLWQVTSQWGLNPHQGANLSELWSALDDRLKEYRCQHVDTVLILDDIDEAQSDVISQVLRLYHLGLAADTNLTIVLSARAEQASRLGDRILDLSELRIDVEPWSLDDTTAWLAQTFAEAGRETAIFTPQATARLHAIAGGVPRRIVQLVELSLIAAAGQELRRIDEHTVEAACNELGAICLDRSLA